MTSMLRTGDGRCLQRAKPSTTVKGGVTAIFRRILDSLSAWDQKQKVREIERLLARSGGRFTDSLERRIMQRATASDWSDYR